jgi:hypothetical protein
MIDRRLSDIQLGRALTAQIPVTPAGLRERISDAARETHQQRRVPEPFAALFDADPVTRRRSLLLAAALAVLAALLGAAVVGNLLERRPDLRTLDPPDDLAAYAETAYRSLASLPAFEMVALETGDRHVIRSDGRGTIRDERLAVNVTRIVSEPRVVQLSVDPEGHAAMIELGPSDVAPGLEMGRLAMQLQTCETDWAYLGPKSVLDRPTHHIACGDRQFWFDAATGIVLRTRQGLGPDAPSGDPIAMPSAAQNGWWEVVELRFGPQPAELFSFEAPVGYEVVDAHDPECMNVWFAACLGPVDSAAPSRRFETLPPATAPVGPPIDVTELVAEVERSYRHLPALELVIQGSHTSTGDPVVVVEPGRTIVRHDGQGRFRTELADDAHTVYIAGEGHVYHSFAGKWRDGWGVFADHGGVGDMRFAFPERCESGWQYKGVDVLGTRAAYHVACASADWWIDAEHLIIVRVEFHPTDPLELVTSIDEVVELRFEDQPPELFRLPPGAIIEAPPS